MNLKVGGIYTLELLINYEFTKCMNYNTYMLF